VTGRIQRLAALAALLLATGCGAGSGEGLDATGNLLSQSQPAGTGGGGGGGEGGASGNPNATLAWVQGNVFGGVCSQCHIGGSGAPFGVDWSTSANTCANVGRASGEKPELNEITAGNPATSYVIWKVEGQGPNGEAIVLGRMPLNNAPLTPDTIQNMKDWIADGVPGC